MTLGLTRNASTSNQFCIPCCASPLGRCCNEEFEFVDKESLTISFKNFRYFNSLAYGTSENNPYLDFYINDFSATLKRRDLIDSLFKLNFPGTKDFNQFANNSLDTVDEGYPENIPIGNMNPSGVLYHLPNRIIDVEIFLNPKTSTVQNGFLQQIIEPLYYYQVKYYAEVIVYCNAIGGYSFTFSLFREWIGTDPVIQTIQGLIPSQIMIVGGMLGSSTVYSCNPLFAKGIAVGPPPSPYGFHSAQDSGKGKFAYYKIKNIDQFGNISYDSSTYAYTPFNFNMDWYITE